MKEGAGGVGRNAGEAGSAREADAHMEVHDNSGTPTLVINDEIHSNMSYAELSGLLDDALAAAE